MVKRKDSTMKAQRVRTLLNIIKEGGDGKHCCMGELLSGEVYTCCSRCIFSETYEIEDDYEDSSEAGCASLQEIGLV